MDNSKMFSWSQNDVIKSLITSVFVAVIAALYGLTSQGGFDVFSADWGEILKIVINSTLITFIGRLGEKFVTDERGKVFGKIG